MEEEKVKIPQECPHCARQYTVREKTNIRFQRKTKILILASIIVPNIGMLILAGLLPKSNLSLAFTLEFTFCTMLGVVFAYNMPRVLILRCAKCKHTENHIIKVKNKHRLFDKNDTWL